MVYLYEMFSRIQDPANIIIRNGNNGLARLAKLVQVRQEVNGLVQAPSEPPKEDNLQLRRACLLLVMNGR